MLLIAARGARVNDFPPQGKFQTKASFVDAYEPLLRKSRWIKFRSRTSSSPYSLDRRTKRDANDEQLQVKNRSELRVQKLTGKWIRNRNVVKGEGE